MRVLESWVLRVKDTSKKNDQTQLIKSCSGWKCYTIKMKCPNCRFEQPDNSETCPACGLIFTKWRARHSPSPVVSENKPPLDQPSTEFVAESPEALADSTIPLHSELTPKRNSWKSPYYYAAILTGVLLISALGGWFFSNRTLKPAIQPPVGSGQYVNTTVTGTSTPGGDQQNSASAFAADTFFADPTDTPEDNTVTPTETPEAVFTAGTPVQTPANTPPSPGPLNAKVESVFTTPLSTPSATIIPNTPTPTVFHPTPTNTIGIGVSIPSFHY
jgi:hypothetical protein